MAAAPPLSKAEYLKRYLSGADVGVVGGSESSRKRRKKRPKPGCAGGKGMRIVDDDVSWSAISTTKPEKEEEEDGDLPVVAEFVDERPEEVKQMEVFRSSAKWKLLGGHSEDLPSHGHFHRDAQDPSPPRRVRHDTPDPCPPRRVRHDTPDPSPPRRVRHDTPDPSPPRRVRHDTPDPSPPRRVRHDTPDPSPPRRVRHDTPDPSPLRRVHHVPDPSPPRRVRHNIPDPSPPKRVRQDTPDPSPPRRVRHDTPDPSPPRRVRHDTLDPSPPRRVRHDTRDPSPPWRAHHMPDPSPPRRVHRDIPDPSPPRRVRHDTRDLYPPRRVRHDTPDLSPPRRGHQASDASPPRKSHRNSSGVSPRRMHCDSSGISSPRRAHNYSPDTVHRRRTLDSSDQQHLKRVRHDSPDSELPRTKIIKAPERSSSKTLHWKEPGPSQPPFSKTSRHERDLDLSPPHKRQAKTHVGAKKQLNSQGHQDLDSDLSPPRSRQRHRNSDSDLSPPRRKKRTKSSDSDLSPPRRSPPPGRKALHMYSGAKTGLVSDIHREEQELKKQDQDTMALGAQFQFAETIFRDKSGRKRNLKLERLEQRRKAQKDLEREELYAQWGKGLAQSRQQQQNVEDAVKEMQKPLARYIDDEDLDRMLREQEREGDPMANFIKKSKAKESKSKKVRPRYNGPAPPPNRFNIWPGYRWDGVDRSNGFEQKRFARLASRKAVEELAYKWSVEDM